MLSHRQRFIRASLIERLKPKPQRNPAWTILALAAIVAALAYLFGVSTGW